MHTPLLERLPDDSWVKWRSWPSEKEKVAAEEKGALSLTSPARRTRLRWSCAAPGQPKGLVLPHNNARKSTKGRSDKVGKKPESWPTRVCSQDLRNGNGRCACELQLAAIFNSYVKDIHHILRIAASGGGGVTTQRHITLEDKQSRNCKHLFPCRAGDQRQCSAKQAKFC